MTLLDLVLERAATVAEGAGWPESTVAHHVSVLVDAGLMRVARAGCAINEERFYRHTGRAIYTSVRRRAGDTGTPVCINGLSLATAEPVPAHDTGDPRTTPRHARIPRERAAAFWERVAELTRKFAQPP